MSDAIWIERHEFGDYSFEIYEDSRPEGKLYRFVAFGPFEHQDDLLVFHVVGEGYCRDLAKLRAGLPGLARQLKEKATQ